MVVSVVIPCYNASALLPRCLDSVLAQTYRGDVEIIVVDDGSTDSSLDIIEKNYAAKVKCVKQSNRGAAAARNQGLSLASGDYVAFLDADDYWHSDFLLKTVSFLFNHPEIVAVSVAQRHITASGDGVVPSWVQNNADSQGFVIENFFSYWAQHNHVCTGSVLMRTQVAKQTGGQREDLVVCEDLEFWACLALQGSWGMIPSVLFVSDGTQVTRGAGWLTKMQRRWNAAPSVEEWKKRHCKCDLVNTPGYQKVLSRIAAILSYCHVLSGRGALARSEVLQYVSPHALTRKMKLIALFAKSSILWWVWRQYVVYKEYHRSV